MSEFRVEVIRIENGQLSKHPNADRLDIVKVHDGYPCIVNRGDFKEGDLAIYVPIDALVPAIDSRFRFLVPEPKRKDDMTDLEWAQRVTRYEAECLSKVRIRARKLRGTFSMGLLIPVGDLKVKVGDDVQELLGIDKYEPDEANRRGGTRPGGEGGFSGVLESCPLPVPIYTDIEGLRKWGRVLEPGEEVIITEKIHGCNARYLHDGSRLWVSSHYQWKRKPGVVTQADLALFKRAHLVWVLLHALWMPLRFFGNFLYRLGFKTPKRPVEPRRPMDVPMTNWWKVALAENLEQTLSMVPGLVVYGEVYGACQDLKYGKPGELAFRAFDAYDVQTARYLDYDDFAARMRLLGIPVAPILYRGPWTEDCRRLAEGKTTLNGADHVREGIVIRPVKERHHERLGRVILKLVGENFLLR